MGTSTSYQAPASPAWRTAKSRFTRFIRDGGGSGGGPAGVTSAYVGAHGGAAKIAASSAPAKTSMKRLGAFLGQVARSGFEGALRENGLGHLIGQGAEVILLGIANLITADGATHDESDARYAAVEVLNRMLDEASTEEDLAILVEGKVDSNGVAEMFREFMIQFIYGRMIRELGERAETAPTDTPTKLTRSQDLLDYIASSVELELIQIDNLLTFDFKGDDGDALADRVFEDAYQVFIL